MSINKKASNDLSSLSKEELVDIINELKSRKKYGLVWENKSEDVVEKCKKELPVLKEVKSKEIMTDPSAPINLLIEGDNFHALSVLNYTHKGKIDVIYIDPPYNTGAKDWKYNNHYVDKNDSYRHSKWLSMMYHRLVLTKQLLSERGVLVCTIDHNEQEALGLLLEDLFPNKERTCVTIVHNPAGIQGQNFSYTHEYAYFIYPKGDRYIGFQYRPVDEADIRNFRDVTGDSSLRGAAKNCFYPVLIKSGEIIGFGDVSEDNYHPQMNVKNSDGVIMVYPIDPQGIERKWRYARHTVENIKNELNAKYIKSRKVWDVVRNKNKFNFKTVWDDSKYFANNYGTQLLNKILHNNSFSYPKSLYAVIDALDSASNNSKDFTVLDFFAGSGTTGHAVLEMNNNDGGIRKFILSTNNENGIATDICFPRIKKVIGGYKNGKEKVKGLGGNLKYYKTSFVRKSISRDDLKIRITSKCMEMLCLRESIYNEKMKRVGYRIFEQNGRIMAVYYSLERSGLAKLKKVLDKMTGLKILYCFTLDPLGLNDDDFADWQDVDLEPIPQKILDIYEQIYEY